MSDSARFIYFLFLHLTNIIFCRHSRTTVGMKTNSPSERLSPAPVFACPPLPWNSAWMNGTHANCKVIAQDFSQDIFEHPVFYLPPKLVYVST